VEKAKHEEEQLLFLMEHTFRSTSYTRANGKVQKRGNWRGEKGEGEDCNLLFLSLVVFKLTKKEKGHSCQATGKICGRPIISMRWQV